MRRCATFVSCLIGAAAALAQPAPETRAAADAPPRAEVSPTPLTPSAPLAVNAVADGVFVQIGAIDDWLPRNGGNIANLGFIIGTRCVAVIDTGGTPAVGERLRAAVERQTQVPVCYVINTHAHPDHVLGNSAFATPGIQFVAGSKFSAAMAAREPYFLNALARDFGIRLAAAAVTYPSIKVDSTLDLDLGQRVVTLQPWPTAHTDNDLTVYDRNTRTLFAGDLLFVQHLPVIDGSLRGWLAAIAELQRLDVATVVPGHGPASSNWPGAMMAERDYLLAVQRETRAAIKSGLTLSQAVEQIGNPAHPVFSPLLSSWQLVDLFHRRNLTAAYAELEWEQ